LPQWEAMRAASNMTCIFSGSTGLYGFRNLIDRLRPIASRSSMVLFPSVFNCI
jgi:hypothetical protein